MGAAVVTLPCDTSTAHTNWLAVFDQLQLQNSDQPLCVGQNSDPKDKKLPARAVVLQECDTKTEVSYTPGTEAGLVRVRGALGWLAAPSNRLGQVIWSSTSNPGKKWVTQFELRPMPRNAG